jgi:hypothetical protein
MGYHCAVRKRFGSHGDLIVVGIFSFFVMVKVGG